MSTTFSGFSEDDIRKLKTGNLPVEDENSRRYIKAIRRTELNGKKPKHVAKSRKPVVEETEDVPAEAKLSETVESVSEHTSNGQNFETTKENDKNTEAIKINENMSPLKPVVLNITQIEKKVIDLDEFQARQKRIEEQNRRRKELLSKALADRTKQTEEEARRLKEIQNEFKKLDVLLSNDVAILRHQIEIVSVDFMEAQKRYHRIEKEFLDAKMVLHQKLEKKEMLTEHLCAIIEKNEERKADKLNELMTRLSVTEKIITETDDKSQNETVNSEKSCEITEKSEQQHIEPVVQS
ncbi:Golgin RAB6 interacting [Carabus blaptoides fortunei]